MPYQHTVAVALRRSRGPRRSLTLLGALTTVAALVLAVMAPSGAEAGITDGLSDGTYAPSRNVSRGQMATFVAAALELAVDRDADSGFADVPPGSTHAGAIAAIRAAGITDGLRDGTCAPSRNVSRGQMATFIAIAFDLI